MKAQKLKTGQRVEIINSFSVNEFGRIIRKTRAHLDAEKTHPVEAEYKRIRFDDGSVVMIHQSYLVAQS